MNKGNNQGTRRGRANCSVEMKFCGHNIRQKYGTRNAIIRQWRPWLGKTTGDRPQKTRGPKSKAVARVERVQSWTIES